MSVLLDPEETETRVLHELIDFTGKDVLEIGCGDGRMTWRFASPPRAPSSRSIQWRNRLRKRKLLPLHSPDPTCAFKWGISRRRSCHQRHSTWQIFSWSLC